MQEKHYFVGIKFEGTPKSYYFSTDFDDLQQGDLVVVETVAGVELGKVVTPLMDQDNYHSNMELKPILRKANKEDLSDFDFNTEQAKKALDITQAEIKKLGLEMDLVDANYTLDGSKVTISFVADGRVDFRELVRILASRLHCRIELRQIVARDKAKMVGGLGVCGLPLCCSTFLTSFEGVSITRAKNQMLTLNIPKLSGACGKLMCCLLYEDDMYTQAKAEFPRLGSIVHTDEGDFSITGMNILSKQIKLSNADNVKFLDLDEVQDLMKGIKRPKPKAIENEFVSSFELPDPTPSFEKGNSNNRAGNKNEKGNNQNNNKNRQGNGNQKGNRPQNNSKNNQNRDNNQNQNNHNQNNGNNQNKNNNHRRRHRHHNNKGGNQGGSNQQQ